MKPETLEEYWCTTRQKQRELRKSRFSTFRFHIAGCKFLLSKLIEYPIIAQLSDTVGQPAGEHVRSMLQLLHSYEEHKQTEDYKSAVTQSQKKSEDKTRLSQQIWWMAYYVEQGNRIRRALEAGDRNDEDLNEDEQWTIAQLNEHEDELHKLRSQQLPLYRGAWAHL